MLDVFLNAVIPVFKKTNKGLIAYGSAVLIKIATRHFLVSAAHIFDEHIKNNTSMLPGGGRKMVYIEGKYLSTPAPNGDRDKDPIDIGFFILPVGFERDVSREYNFLPEHMIDSSDNPKQGNLYWFSGFPCTATKRNPIARKITSQLHNFSGEVVTANRYIEMGFSVPQNTIINFDAKKVFLPTKRQIAPKDPHGKSGGAIWRGKLLEGSAKYLTGIIIEHDKKRKCLIGSHIAYFTECVRKLLPELRQYLPKCNVLDVEINVI